MLEKLSKVTLKTIKFGTETYGYKHLPTRCARYHRRTICELLNDGSNELDFSASILVEDAKNHTAWAHR